MKSFIRITASLLAALTVLLSFNTAAYALGIEDAYHHGDVTLDNKIDVTDATAIQKYAVALAEFSPEQLSKADVNYDGVINVADATLIQKIASGLYIPLAGKKGVDISSHNGDIDIKKIRDAGYSFVMIRCGYGEDKTSQDDKRFEENVRKCEELGMPWGVYLYSYALTVDDARSEARHVLRLLDGKRPTLPVAFDMEDADGYKSKHGMPSNKQLISICKTFINGVREAGYYPALYANLSWLKMLDDEELLTSCDIWVAQWNSSCTYTRYPASMWQYGGETNYLESNSIPGIGTIDKDVSYKDYPMLIVNGGYNNW